MAAARLGEALNQRLGTGVEKQHAQVERLRKVFDDGGHFVERTARTCVDSNGQTRLPLTMEIRRELGQEARGQVVNAIVAGVFERVQGDGFAGAGDAGNQNDAHE